MQNRDWVVYLIRCADKSIYCGITNNLEKRMGDHDAGKGAKYTRSRRPIELVAASPKMSKSDALKFEYRIKQLPSGKKIIELTNGKDETNMDMKKELGKVSREMRTLSIKLEKLIAAVDKFEDPKVTKAITAKKVTGKKSANLSAIDTVLKVIKGSKKGVNTATLMKKTGFNEKKIFNNIYKLRKLGKIKAEKKGIYILV